MLAALACLSAACHPRGARRPTAAEIFADSSAAALAEAAAEGDTARIRRLIAARADPNAADRMGDTPLHVAAKIHAFARVLDLLEAGADPGATTKRGTTFQTYLDRAPTDILTDKARREREAIAAWMRARD